MTDSLIFLVTDGDGDSIQVHTLNDGEPKGTVEKGTVEIRVYSGGKSTAVELVPEQTAELARVLTEETAISWTTVCAELDAASTLDDQVRVTITRALGAATDTTEITWDGSLAPSVEELLALIPMSREQKVAVERGSSAWAQARETEIIGLRSRLGDGQRAYEALKAEIVALRSSHRDHIATLMRGMDNEVSAVRDILRELVEWYDDPDAQDQQPDLSEDLVQRARELLA